MEELFQQLGKVINGWSTLGTMAGLIALVNLLTYLTKLPFLAKFIKAAWRPWVAIGLGAIGGAFTALASGKSLPQALVAGVVVGLGAIGVHEGWTSMTPTEAAKKEATAAVTKALSGPEAEVKVKVDALKAELDKAVALPDERERLKALAALARNGVL